MPNSKKTKREFIFSFLSIILCAAMLAGTTFAWFTDSESSVNNTIVSGNLDLELYTVDANKEATPVDPQKSIFSDALWEPGHVETVTLKVANVGSLALQYKLSVDVVSEQPGFNKSNGDIYLSKYLKYAVVNEYKTYPQTPEGRASAIADAEKAGAQNIEELRTKPVTQYDSLYAKNDTPEVTPFEKYITLIVYMPTTVGNEANNESASNLPFINLGLNLFATQIPHETDSFGNDYDIDIPIETATKTGAVGSAIKNGESVLLTDSITETDNMFAKGDSVVDLNGKTLTIDKSIVISDANASVTIKNGKIEAGFIPIMITKGELILDNVKVVSNNYAVYNTGGKVKVSDSNITSNNDYTIYNIPGTTTIDIENSNITSNTKSAIITAPGNITNIKNSNVTSNSSTDMAILVNNSNTNITGGTIRSRHKGIIVQGSTDVSADGATFSLTDTDIIADNIGIESDFANNHIKVTGANISSNYYGFYQNGWLTGGDFTLTDCTITDTYAMGVYIANNDTNPKPTLIMNNCKVTGPGTVELKFTNATINNSTLTATADKSFEYNRSGNCTLGYPLAFTSNATGSDSDEAAYGTATLTSNVYIAKGVEVSFADAVYNHLNGATITNN